MKKMIALLAAGTMSLATVASAQSTTPPTAAPAEPELVTQGTVAGTTITATTGLAIVGGIILIAALAGGSDGTTTTTTTTSP